MFLEWRIDEKKVPKESTWAVQGSCRQIANKVGKALHRHLLESNCLGESEMALKSIDILRHVAKVANGDPGEWDTPVLLDNTQLTHLEAERTYLVQNNWITKEGPVARGTLAVISDASNIGYGFAIVDCLRGSIVHQCSRNWPEGMKTLHIFVLEAYASLAAIKWARKNIGQEPLIVMTDNTAFAGCLKRRYSTNVTVQRWMKSTHGTHLEVISVTSADNVTDGLSRGVLGCIDLNHVKNLISEHRNGRRATIPTNEISFVEGIRHEEPDCEWDELESHDMESL